jgi:predicted DNA binding CopG/RHH family protein
MHPPGELPKLDFYEWPDSSILQAAVENTFPESEKERLSNIKKTLPKFISKYENERQACDEMQDINPRDPFVIEWDKELKRWWDIIVRAEGIATVKELFHKQDAVCARCEEPLVRIEITVCDACKGGKFLH